MKSQHVLKTWCLGSLMAATLFVAGAALASSKPQASDLPTTVTELNVERINIVEADGTIRMVISNKGRFPDPIVDGESVQGVREASAGIIMCNDDGNEMGGLVFGGERGNIGHGFFFDQDRQDQTLGLVHQEGIVDGRQARYTGISVWDRPFDASILDILEEMSAVQGIEDSERKQVEMDKLRIAYGERHRVFLGRGWDEAAGLNLYDGQGRPRLRLTVTSDGDASLEFLDAEGAVTRRIGP